MANRFPLVINNSTSLVGELPSGDSLNLGSSGIFDGISTGANGEVLKSTGTQVRWSRAADVYLTDAQTLTNKTFSSCILNGSLNTVTSIANSSLVNSSISINGTSVPLGGSITLPDTNDNTLYSISVADGVNATQKRIRLTAGGSGSGIQDIFLVADSNVSISRTNTDTLTFGITRTKLRAPATSAYIEGDITFTATGGTRISQSSQTITIDSDPFPIGGIIMWSGSIASIPTKWALCNGQIANGITTPDLRDRFIVGAGTTYNVGSTGGSKDSILVSHNHTGTTGTESQSHTHTGNTGNESQSHTHSGTTGDNSVGHTHSGNTGSESANHTHSGNSDSQGFHAHGGSTNFAAAAHSHNFNTGQDSNNHSHGYADIAYNFGYTGKTGGPGTAMQNWASYDLGRTTQGVNAAHFHGGTTAAIGADHQHGLSTDGSGSHSHNISLGSQSASHTHSFTTGGASNTHTHNMTTGNASQSHTHLVATGNASLSHTHDITVSTQGVSGTNANLPPYYALAYIMKVE